MEDPILNNDDVLSIDDIMNVSDVRYLNITVPEWPHPKTGRPGIFRAGSLNAGDMIEFIEANEGPSKRTAGLRLLIKSQVDKDGNRIGRMEQLDSWKKRDAKVCNRIVLELLKHNGIDKKTQAAAASALKNDSSEADSAASPSN